MHFVLFNCDAKHIFQYFLILQKHLTFIEESMCAFQPCALYAYPFPAYNNSVADDYEKHLGTYNEKKYNPPTSTKTPLSLHIWNYTSGKE